MSDIKFVQKDNEVLFECFGKTVARKKLNVWGYPLFDLTPKLLNELREKIALIENYDNKSKMDKVFK